MACWVPAGSRPGGVCCARAERAGPVSRPGMWALHVPRTLAAGRDTGRLSGHIPSSLAPTPSPQTPAYCILPAPSWPCRDCRDPATPAWHSDAAAAPRQQDAGTSRSVSSAPLGWLAGPCWPSCMVEQAVGGSCSTSACTKRNSEAQVLLPWALMDGFSLGQPVLPRSFLSVCPQGSLPVLAPLAGRSKGSRRQEELWCCLKGFIKN